MPYRENPIRDNKECMCNVVNYNINHNLKIITSYEEQYNTKLPLIPIIETN